MFHNKLTKKSNQEIVSEFLTRYKWLFEESTTSDVEEFIKYIWHNHKVNVVTPHIYPCKYSLLDTLRDMLVGTQGAFLSNGSFMWTSIFQIREDAYIKIQFSTDEKHQLVCSNVFIHTKRINDYPALLDIIRPHEYDSSKDPQ